MDKILISERVYKISGKVLKKFLNNRLNSIGQPKKNIHAIVGMLIKKDNIITDIISFRNRFAGSNGCNEMSYIPTSLMTQATLKAYKRKCIPIGIIRIGILEHWNGKMGGKGIGILQLGEMSKKAICISVYPKEWHKYLIKHTDNVYGVLEKARKDNKFCFVVEDVDFNILEYELRKEERKGEK